MPIGIGVLSALLAAFSAGDPRWLAALDYHRVDIAGGQVWRLVTAHVMHLSAEHALLDIAGLACVAWIFAEEIRWRLQCTTFLLGIASIDVALWSTGIARYAGLSGVLHAWFATGVVCWLLASRHDAIASRKRLWGAALAIGLAVKLIVEQRHAAFWLDGATFPVATIAHRWGAMAGVVCGLGAVVLRRRARADVAGFASRGR